MQILDFSAEWCGPCKMLSPIIKELSKENPNISIVDIDVDNNREIAEQYRIMSVPTLVYMIDGVEVDRSIGYISKKLLEERIGKLLNANS